MIEEDLKSGRLRAVCGNELSGAGNRHGLGRPRHSGRGARLGSLGAPAHRRGLGRGRSAALLASDPERAVGEALLDQQVIAGGQRLQCEICFLSGLSPWQEVGAVPDLRRVMAPGTGSSSSIARAGPLTTGDSAGAAPTGSTGTAACPVCAAAPGFPRLPDEPRRGSGHRFVPLLPTSPVTRAPAPRPPRQRKRAKRACRYDEILTLARATRESTPERVDPIPWPPSRFTLMATQFTQAHPD